MKNFFFLVLGLIIILGSVLIFFSRASVGENQKKIIKVNNSYIKVEIADTLNAREKGLSGRKTLLDNTGMLFVFDNPARRGFWMKDMNFAIDIVWIDENYLIVDIDKNVSPRTFPEVFYADRAIKYVLEIPTGFVDKYQIATGTMIQY